MLLINPTIFSLERHDKVAISLIGLGRKKLRKLQDDMKFQNLKTSSHRISMSSGHTITVSSSQGINKVIILSPNRSKDKLKMIQECFCNCNFTIGNIIDIAFVGGVRYYTVISCRGDRYMRIENVLSSDFTPWRKKDVIMLMAYHDMLFDCDKNNYLARGCSPIKDIANVVATSEWRTTLRIMPICAMTLPKWLPNA